MCQLNNHKECVILYEDVFWTRELPATRMVKTKILQAIIQIERPTNWTRQKILDIINHLINAERYNPNISRTTDKFKIRRKAFDNIT
jgi:hypothetical protein